MTFYRGERGRKEEDQRRGRDRGDSVEDNAVDVRWPLSSWRMRPAGLLQRQLSEERN
jgi:hypothetical protein